MITMFFHFQFFFWAWNYSCCCVVASFGLLRRYQLRSTMNFTRRPSASIWIPWPPHTSLQRYISLHLIDSLSVAFCWFNSRHLHHIMVGVSHNICGCFCLDNMHSLHNTQLINKCYFFFFHFSTLQLLTAKTCRSIHLWIMSLLKERCQKIYRKRS